MGLAGPFACLTLPTDGLYSPAGGEKWEKVGFLERFRK